MLNKIRKLSISYKAIGEKKQQKIQTSTTKSKPAALNSPNCPSMGRRNAICEKSSKERKQIKQSLKREKQINILKQYGIF